MKKCAKFWTVRFNFWTVRFNFWTCSDSSGRIRFFHEEFFNFAETNAERLEVLSNIGLIAACLDPSTIKSEFLPILSGVVPIDSLVQLFVTDIAQSTGESYDEILHCLAQQCVTLADYIGEETELKSLLPSLEVLAFHDENNVRNAVNRFRILLSDFQAVEAMGTILDSKCSPLYQPVFAQFHLVPIFYRLASGTNIY